MRARLKRLLLGDQLNAPDEIRDAVYLCSGDIEAKQARFWLLLVLSAVIASAGVIGNSTATVIGAMIVAPLATPIQGVGAAIASGELKPLVQSTAMVLGAMAVVIAIGALMYVTLPQLTPLEANEQITSRVSPTIIDLVAAAAVGLAGAFAVTRRDIGDIVPGVAIAISLVPPLAVVGITLAGETAKARSARCCSSWPTRWRSSSWRRCSLPDWACCEVEPRPRASRGRGCTSRSRCPSSWSWWRWAPRRTAPLS